MVVSWLALGGCVREPLERLCPDLDTGELVVSEVRGKQPGVRKEDDPYGQWIELYNAGGGAIDLSAVQLIFRELNGELYGRVMVRDEGMTIDPGGFFVLGCHDSGPDGATPEHIDYNFIAEFESDLDIDLAVEVTSCGLLVDRAVYRHNLGSGGIDQGTVALDGAMPPDADDNDDPARWCNDLDIAGTPGQPNPQSTELVCMP